MPIPEPDKIWPKLEKAGEDEVRKRLSMGVYPDYKLPVIEEWLQRKTMEKKTISKQKSEKEIPEADKIIESLKTHKAISFLVVIGVIVIGIANFTDAISKLFNLFQSEQHEISSISGETKNDPLIQIHAIDKSINFPEGVTGQNSFSIIIPQDLSELMDKMKKEQVEYPERSRDLNIINKAIQNGDFYTATMFSQRVIKRQNNLRAYNHSGNPKNINDKLKLISVEKIGYPDRARDLRIADESIENGDFDTANIFLDRIILQQRNLRGIKN